MMTIKQYIEKLNETCLFLITQSNSPENTLNHTIINKELNGYSNDLPSYRVLRYQLYVDYYDSIQKTIFRRYCVDMDFFTHEFNLIEFNKVYIYSGLLSIQKNLKSLIYREMENSEIELLNLNVHNKKIISAYHHLNYNDFKQLLKNIIDNVNRL